MWPISQLKKLKTFNFFLILFGFLIAVPFWTFAFFLAPLLLSFCALRLGNELLLSDAFRAICDYFLYSSSSYFFCFSVMS